MRSSFELACRVMTRLQAGLSGRFLVAPVNPVWTKIEETNLLSS